jgi:hypothetical protein
MVYHGQPGLPGGVEADEGGWESGEMRQKVRY